MYRAQPERQLRPGETHLASAGHQLLSTKFGPLDVLGMIGKSLTWDWQKIRRCFSSCGRRSVSGLAVPLGRAPFSSR